MFCPPNETIQQLTEKTKLLAQKCSQQMRASSSVDQSSNSSSSDSTERQQVATFKSYIAEVENGSEPEKIDFPDDSRSPINCLTVNLSSINRVIKNRCSFMSSTSYNFGTFPRNRPKKATAKWFIKVSFWTEANRNSCRTCFILSSFQSNIIKLTDKLASLVERKTTSTANFC